MDRDSFVLECSKIGVLVTDRELDLLDRYYSLLVEWNEKINLTAITDKKDVYLKHFYDSLCLVRVIDLNSVSSLCDIGTGAGFPGIVLKIFYPHLKLTLMDALNKRINFLKEVCSCLELSDVHFIHGRAEEYGRDNRELFDVVTPRAVASMPMLLEYSIPMVKKGKYFIALKGDEDISKVFNALKVLKCDILEECRFNLPIEESVRTIIKVVKNDETPLKYPRRFAEMKKKPL